MMTPMMKKDDPPDFVRVMSKMHGSGTPRAHWGASVYGPVSVVAWNSFNWPNDGTPGADVSYTKNFMTQF